MSQASRITKIICPCCKGTGLWPSIAEALQRDIACNWCGGAKRVATRVARHYADNLYTIAVGGYINGDHDIGTRDRMTAEAVAVFNLLGEVPPWIEQACRRSA